MIIEHIQKLRTLMCENNIDTYLIPTADDHESEYVADYFKARVFMSGFTGSAGTLVVTREKAGLWTDGRYFIQAENQLKGSGITLYKMGQEGVCTFEEFLIAETKENGVIGFDGRVVNSALGKRIENNSKNISVVYNVDLVNEIWTDRPAFPSDPAFYLKDEFSGRSLMDKLQDCRQKMAENQADVHLLSGLDQIAWLFNIRGNDVSHTPVVYSYALVDNDKAVLYTNQNKITEEIHTAFENAGVMVEDYEEFFSDVESLKSRTVWIDGGKLNYRTVKCLDASNRIIDKPSWVDLAKAMKNKTEQKNTRQAHILDGAAVSEFIYWVKKNVGRMEMNEYSVSEKLEEYRRNKGAFDLSFTTICGYNANAAMMHYSATKDSYAVLKPEGMLLVDSGGHYMSGSTDITRTFALGPVKKEWKIYNTTVLKGMIDLAMARFLYGSTGMNLDILARGPVWKLDIDYQCGTGHGVGHLLSVHEGPHGIRWKKRALEADTPLEEGMIVSDEPGIYLENECGIRIENELLVQKGVKNFYGQFMEFETLTCVPIDRDLILVELLNDDELKWLNNYHQWVYSTLKSLVGEEVEKWLKEVTSPLTRTGD